MSQTLARAPTPWRSTYINTGVTAAILDANGELVTPANSGRYIASAGNVCAELPNPQENIKELVDISARLLFAVCLDRCEHIAKTGQIIHTELCAEGRKTISLFAKELHKNVG